MSTHTLPTPATNAFATTPLAARGAHAARAASAANGMAAFGNGGDDAFAQAMERSREAARTAARADSAREGQRPRASEPAPRQPEASAGASRDAGSARQGERDADDQGADNASGTADAATGSAASAAAERQRRAAAEGGKPYPGNEPLESEVKEPVVCFAPEHGDDSSTAAPGDATGADAAAALAAATALAAVRDAQRASASTAGGTADADAGTAEAQPAAATDTAGSAAGKRGVVIGGTRVRGTAAGTAGVRDDTGPVGGPTLSPFIDRATAALWATHKGLPPAPPSSLPSGPASAATAAVSSATASLAGPGTSAGDTLAAAMAGGAAAADGSGAAAALRGAEPFSLPARPAAGGAAEATLAARPGAPEFAPQLGAQLAVWVRDGVHEARLQLNPADMGPVRVDIQLDGTAAQVSLTAGNDETRQALQDALPGLAGSLRDAGFTLAGGGVFDQAPQRDAGGRSADAGRGPAAGSAVAAAASAGAQAVPTRRRGLVDLVA